MKKKILLSFLVIIIVLVGIPNYGAKAEWNAISLKSHGNIIYKGNDGAVEIYSEDLALLQDEVFTLGNIFSPYNYSHNHQAEYININEQTHTIHCDECGSSMDIVNAHEAVSYDKYEIKYEGLIYIGYNYLCKCGYRWIKEPAHNLAYEIKDDKYHKVSCRLADTQYCINPAAAFDVKIHDLTVEPVDGNDHKLICYLCKYEKEEECDFTDHYEFNEDETEVNCFCICGNYIIEPYTELIDPIPPEESEDTETDKESSESKDTEGTRESERSISENNIL